MPQIDAAARIGEQLLAELGIGIPVSGTSDHPAIAWRRSGLFELSGHKDGPARMVPVPISGAVDGAMLALKALSRDPERLPPNGSILLGERARLMQLKRNGHASAGRHCRLIEAKEGRFALNLARDDDWVLLEAWLEEPASDWAGIERIALSRDAATLVRRGSDLGLAIAMVETPDDAPWFIETKFSSVKPGRTSPLVVDLSSLWAGPLAGHLLHLTGARVVKVESTSRPDGAREGNAEFYLLLNGGKRCAAFDFTSAQGRTDLQKLIAAADIVIEASRPRALRQLGIEAEKLLIEKPGKVWLRLAAHGADENRIGFGDDIGVAAGLCSAMEHAWGEPFFVGDAIADPVSGIFGALAARTKWQAGHGCLITLSMRDTVRLAMQAEGDEADWRKTAWECQAMADADKSDLYPMRTPTGIVEELGVGTAKIMADLC